MRKFIYISVYFLLTANVFAQNPSDKIDLNNLNVKYLEHLIKVGIDSVREVHKLKPVMNDSILYVASNYHAGYLMEKDILSHYQEDRPEFYSPQNRAEMFGAVGYLTGENVAQTYVHKPVVNKKTGKESVLHTYKETALNFVDAWVHSPPHYKNIITPDWQITGVAISVDPDRNFIKAVQMFGKVRGRYYFEENKEFFPYSTLQMPRPTSSFEELPDDMERVDLPYKLKWPKDNDPKCETCKEVIPQFKSLELRPDGRKIYVYSEDVDLIYQLINNRRDGFALEVVYYTPVECENPQYYEKPSRRNGYSLINGELHEPHYKKVLRTKGFKSKFNWLWRIKKDDKVKYFKYRLAKLPKKMPDYYETNLVIIQKKRICYFKHLASLCTHANPDASLAELSIGSVIDEIPVPPKKEFIPDYTERDIYFTVPFERGRADYNYADVKPMIDTLTFDKFDVSKIDIKAFTSLEGSREINKKLQLRRANSIVKAIENEQKKDIPSTVESFPNWKLFKEQIGEEKALASLKGLTEDSIRERLKDKEYVESIEPYLAQQRRADIVMHIRTEVTEGNSNAYLIFQFQSLVRDIQRLFKEKGELDDEIRKLIKELSELHEYIYFNVAEGNLPDSLILHLRIPDAPFFNELKISQLWLEAAHDPNYWKDTTKMLKLYSTLAPMAMDPEIKPIWQYNFMVLQAKLWDVAGSSLSPFEIHDLMNSLTAAKLKGKVRKGMLDSLRFDVFARLVPMYFPQHLDEEVNGRMQQCLMYIYAYYKARPMTKEKAFEIGNYLASYNAFQLAVNIMKPFATGDKPHPGILALLAKLGAVHPDEQPDSPYYDWLIGIADKMPRTDWCNMFIGPCNISFQIFDVERVYKKYCSHCKGVPNYVTGRGIIEED